MPVIDKDVAITEILGSHKPFRAVLKQSVDDFIVNEVLLNGKVARLTALAKTAPRYVEEKPMPAPPPKEQSPPSPAEHTTLPIPFTQLDQYFPNESAASVSQSVEKLHNEKLTELTLPICAGKEERTLIHQWVRENLPSYVTDTVEANAPSGAKAVRMRLKGSCRPWTARKEQRTSRGGRGGRRTREDRAHSDAQADNTFDPRENQPVGMKRRRAHPSQPRVGRDTYVSFVLWKRNKDTNEALTSLAKFLRKPVGAFAYAGTKDKRAVTTQLVQVRGVSEARFAQANVALSRSDRRGFRSLAVGNVEVLSSDSRHVLRLGDLRGNRFTLVLRGLQLETPADKENIMAAVDSIRNVGFVNYFGLQRFGSGVSPTHETGFAFFRGDFEDVCRRLLLPLVIDNSGSKNGEGLRPERRKVVEALDKFAKKDISARELLRELPRWMIIESAIVKSFMHDEERDVKKYDYKAAFGKLPRNLRKMYGHAVQSYLWNVMASERIRLGRANGQLQMHALEGDLIPAKEHPGRELSLDTEVRLVSKIEEKEKSVSLHRVLIPVLGSEVSVPNAAYGKVAKLILEQEKINIQERLTSEYGMRGTYRWLLAKPGDVETEFVSYAQRSDIIVPGACLPTSTSDDVDCVKDNVRPEKRTATVEQSTRKKELEANREGTGVSLVELKSEDAGQETKAPAEKVDGSETCVKSDGGDEIRVGAEEGVGSTDQTMKAEGGRSNGVVAATLCDFSASADASGMPAEDKGTERGPSPVHNSSTATDANGIHHNDSSKTTDGKKSGKGEDEGLRGNEKSNMHQALVICFTLGCAEYATMLVRELTRMDSSAASQKLMQDSSEVAKPGVPADVAEPVVTTDVAEAGATAAF